MRRLFSGALAGAVLLCMSVAAQAGEWKKLIEPADLAGLMAVGDILVIDIRGAKSGKGGPGYDGGHIPGSVSSPYGKWRGDKKNPGARMGDERLVALLRGLGVQRKRPTVIAHQGANPTDFGAAARVYWTLKSSGIKQIAILNGGVEGWWKAGGKLTDDPTAPKPSKITTKLSDKWLVDRNGVFDIVEGKRDAVLLDARPMPFFQGKKKHKAAKRAGTLPGAISLTHATWFEDGSPVLSAPESVLGRLRKAGLAAGDKPLVSFCNTGHWAATNWFAASELAGIKGVKMYPESMVGWSQGRGKMKNAK